MPAVVAWLRDDLRLDDNPALLDAAGSGLPVVVVYIWSPMDLGAEAPRGASMWWLHNALADLDAALRARGSELVILSGPADRCLRRAMDGCGARDVFWNRRYTPVASRVDAEIERQLHSDGYGVHITSATLLREPWAVEHDAQPYKVFTAYHRAAQKLPMRGVAGPAPDSFRAADRLPEGVTLDSLGLLPKLGWASGLERAWVPTAAGLDVLMQNMARIVPDYHEERDFPWKAGTSRLSPYMRFGQVGVAQIMRRLADVPDGPGKACFLKELHWREFAYHILFHFPNLPQEPMNPSFAHMHWRDDETQFKQWQRGLTGYPIVDAGMRQLWQTGWMHNRVRMIAGSFLVKDLLMDWRAGAEWFMSTLVDADVAGNTLGWQWVGGCGPDAAPFFRVFNPVLQARKFDPDGYYVRRYVPELAYMPDIWIHTPWKAPKAVLEEAGVVPGRDYPLPVVDHATARLRALKWRSS